MEFDYMQIMTIPNRKGKYLAFVKGNKVTVIARFVNDEMVGQFSQFMIELQEKINLTSQK